jgi:hypothetical protein
LTKGHKNKSLANCKNIKTAGFWLKTKHQIQYLCGMGVGGVFLASIALCIGVAIVAEIVERIK